MEDPQAPPDGPQFVFKKRSAKTKSTLRKRTPSPPPAADSDSGFTSSDDESGRQIKRRRKNVGVTASSSTTKRADEAKTESLNAVRAVPTNADNATLASNWYDENMKTPLDKTPAETSGQSVALDGTYKGVANYQSFIQKNPDMLKQVGPQKTSSNVRTITVTDFAPDVCKDYKQTGFCGFGDSCKFLHAREDYKQGWQLDEQWDKGLRDKKIGGKTIASANRSGAQGGVDEDDDALLEKIPFKCIICKDDYKQPIMTKCEHYFCEACALKRYRKDPSCAACGASTNGIFNPAKKLNKLLERKQKRQEEVEKDGEAIGSEPPKGFR